MRVLITYASVGYGHLKAAEALYHYLKDHHPEIEAELIDVLDKAGVFFCAVYSGGYNLLVTQLAVLWKALYWLTRVRPSGIFLRQIILWLNKIHTRNFQHLVVQKDPDYIFSTHFLSTELVAGLKRKRRIQSKLISVVTDFGVHPFWISTGTDLYIVATEFASGQLVNAGVDAGQIKVYGIPIDEKFTLRFDKAQLCRKLGLEDEFTVLVMTGSFGLGPIEKIIGRLSGEAQVIVVTGRNKRLFDRLSGRKIPRTFIFGFIDNIHELMAVSDIMITKPGGLSIAEAISMDLVPLFISAIPGQERSNIDVLRVYGIGIEIKPFDKIRSVILDLENHQEKLECLRQNIRRFKKPFAAREILACCTQK